MTTQWLHRHRGIEPKGMSVNPKSGSNMNLALRNAYEAEMGDWREVIVQWTRIVAAAVFSRIWVAIGNTGRANFSAIKPKAVPDDLRSLLEDRDV